MNKPEKNPKRVAAGKNLANSNKAAKKAKEMGEISEKPTRIEHPESSCENGNDNDEMDGTTRLIMLLGLAGFGYYLYTTTGDSKKDEVVKKESNVVQNNNDVQENTVNRLRSFKN